MALTFKHLNEKKSIKFIFFNKKWEMTAIYSLFYDFKRFSEEKETKWQGGKSHPVTLSVLRNGQRDLH